MKSRNLIIGLLAMVFAVGSAFVSPKLSPESVWVKARMTQTGPYVCKQTTAQCDQSGIYTCRVSVPTVYTGGTQTTGRRGTSCAEMLKNTTTTAYWTVLTSGEVPFYVEE